MTRGKVLLYLAIALFLLILLNSATFIVQETEQVIITQFGKPVGDPITDPGIHVKVPFIQQTHFFEKRFLEWDGDPNQVPTKDKRFIWVNTYARWRISDPLLFFQRLRDELGAQSRLDDILDGETRTAIANHDLVEVVRSTNRDAAVDPEATYATDDETFQTIKTGRGKITKEILAAARERSSDLGIELLDLRFKRLDYVEEVRRKVYDRMITERKRIAEKFRSEGQGEASRILGEKERELKSITSEAFKTSEEIRGRADASATAIYARAYDRSADTRDFYKFMKSMEAYEATFDTTDMLILSSDSEFYKFLKNQRGQ